ncbi:MAG: hypothetical protein DDT41_01774 [candidate division WS2 bacterium]|nr:hypothetical protein [Candidatus Psychracetigena formicireducens]
MKEVTVLVGVATLSFRFPIGAVWVAVGYIEDGVTLEYSTDTVDIETEETLPIRRVITKESLSITCNMAESSLMNIDKAIAGSVLTANTITIGSGRIEEMSIRIVGRNPAGFARTIEIPLATTTGAVAMPYKKVEKTVVPITFQALEGVGAVCTIVDEPSGRRKLKLKKWKGGSK